MGYVYGKWNNNSDGWAVWVTPNYSSGNFGYVTFYYGNYGSNECASNLRSTVVTLNQWHYIRITRSSNTMYMSVNGKVGTRTNYTSGITFTDNRTFNANATMNMLGGSVGNTLGIAYLSDLRVINGTALTTGNFTPPTSPVTAVTNTKLLTCNDAPDVFDAAGGERRLKTNGNAKSSTAQTKNAESSIVFDGSGDTITIAEQVPRNEKDDWTIEFWVRPNNVTNRMDMFSQYNASSAGRMTLNMNNSGIVNFFQNGLTGNSGSSISSSSSLTANVWQHIAVTNNNGVRSMFIDGEYQGQSTGSQAMADLEIMIGNAVDRTDYMNGYMEDIRLTKGLSRYPFIPAKETLEAITNTDLLIAHAATITDGSSNSIAVTANGNAAVSSFAPKSGMYSVAFDGTGDYLKTASSSNLNLYNTDFTIEGWFYATAPAGNEHIWASYIDASNRESLYFSNSTTLNWWVNGSNRISATVAANTWHHVAIVNNSNTTTMFIDGSRRGEWASTYTNGNRLVWLGTYNNGGVASDSFTGYISNIRLLRGTALYSNSFTPPTAELEA